MEHFTITTGEAKHDETQDGWEHTSWNYVIVGRQSLEPYRATFRAGLLCKYPTEVDLHQGILESVALDVDHTDRMETLDLRGALDYLVDELGMSAKPAIRSADSLASVGQWAERLTNDERTELTENLED